MFLIVTFSNLFHVFQYMVKCGKKETPEEGSKAEVSEKFKVNSGVGNFPMCKQQKARASCISAEACQSLIVYYVFTIINLMFRCLIIFEQVHFITW